MPDDDKPKRRGMKGGPPGPGRPKGSKDSISRATREELAAFFMECTAANVRWRQTMRRKLEMALDPHEWHNLSKLALSYGIGLPAKLAPPPPPQRDGLYFVHYKTARALECGSDDVMEAKTTRMIRERDAELALLALQEGGGREDPEVILAARAAAAQKGKVIEVVDVAEEQLEAVDLPVLDLSAIRDMLPPQPSGYERDRAPRNRS